ncbi:ribosome-binding protein 1, putative [Babesia caballi]|uniref:Ribosome-binding protein 1, putative n=1 Tax=Babesia caballi TaxID=5871 RepID=A0AAV4LWG8_BABCB|nr:ribosome-binding protein 1, putative [Babesia caballi]
MTISLTTCPSNLKEAIDWILRVTGKDGQGSDNTPALAEAVKKLLGMACSDAESLNRKSHKNGNELNKLRDGLQKAVKWVGENPKGFATDGPISRLSGALATFMGYENFRSSFLGKDNWQLTGGGILPANVARHQVCNAVLNFVIRFLEGLCEIKVDGDTNKSKVLDVIGTLRRCVGTGTVPEGFKELVQKIEEKVQTDLNWLQDNAGQKLKEVFEKLKTVMQTDSLENGSSGSVKSSNIDNFLGEVFGKVKGEQRGGTFTKFTNLCIQLSKLFKDNDISSGSLSTSDPLQLKSTLQQNFNGAKNATTINALVVEISDLRNKSKKPNAATVVEFMGSMAFADGIINTGKNGTALVGAAMSKFTEFKEAMSKALSSSSFATFTKELKDKVSSQDSYTGCPLSAMFYGASCYFRYQQIKCAKPTAKSPSTIREMLYFLAALPYTAVYDELENYTTTSLSTPLPVAVSGSATKNETMSSSDLTGILVTSCLSSSWVIGTIEGRGNFNNPLLHDLYCNGMGFTYPSGSTLLNIIAEYAYALQFQLSFLYQQCSGTYSKARGWNECRYGAKINATGLSRSLEAMAPAIPFLYQLFMAKDPNTLPGALFDRTKHCHKWDRSGQLKHQSHSSGPSCPNPNDMWSLYQALSPTTNKSKDKDIYEDCPKGNCGGYLYPLTYTFGSTFAPKHASSYVSWFFHLTDDLKAGLREILERFKGLFCTNCKTSCHSNFTGSSTCRCPSIVDCADLLPLLYDYGFSFNNAYYLKGVKYAGNSFQSDPQNNRTCGKFYNQLSAVLASTQETPLLKLLHSIDDFLYLFRFYFFYKLSSFWLCSLLVLLYLIFYGIDVLHFRSHVHFPSSHIIAPIGLLTTGNAPALTKLTYYMP